jgi:diphthamide synthase (EF-2-diphthine--ammonia ligase)
MEIRKCKKCGIIMGTRPNTVVTGDICGACINIEKKKTINFKERQEWLTQYIKDNKTHPVYDCLVGVSGGKDSHMIVKRLVEEHNCKNILLVNMTDEFTKTQAGMHNISNLAERYNCDLITYRFNPKTFKEKAREGLEQDLFPLKWFEDRLYKTPFEIAKKFGIKLVFYGENSEFEYGSADTLEIFHPLSDDETKLIYLGAIWPYSIMDSLNCAREAGFRDLDYYNEWQRQGQLENYTQIDSIGYVVAVWCKFPKFGFQRVSDIACRFVRDGILTKEQAEQYIAEKDWVLDPAAKKDLCRAIEITEEFFDECVDKHANRDLLQKDVNGHWRRKDYFPPKYGV